MQTEPVYDTKPLLRPQQAKDAQSEIKVMEHRLANEKLEDKAALSRQLQRVRLNYETQAPRTPVTGSEEESAMVKRSDELLAYIVPRMNSQEEMRKNPHGSVEKFNQGENSPQMKKLILEWKNLQLRLKPGDAAAPILEKHRPLVSTLNMETATIPGKQFFLPPAGAPMGTTFSDDQLALIRQLDPKTAEMLALMPNEGRAEVKQIIQKRKLTEKQLGVLAEGRAKRTAKLAEKQG